MRSCTCQRLIRCVSCTVFVCVFLGGHIGAHASLEPLGQSCSAMALGRILWTFLWSCFSFSRSRWKCFGGLPQAFGRCWSICANFVGSLFEASLSRWRYWSLSITTIPEPLSSLEIIISIINIQCVVYLFHCDLCDYDATYVGFTARHLGPVYMEGGCPG